MQRLVRGVHEFQREVVGKKAEFFADLAKGQLFITCSDSRLSPNGGGRAAGGRLHLHGRVYRIESGEVLAYDPVESRFLALAQYQPQPSQPHGFTTLPSI